MLGQQERHRTMTPPQESPSAVEVGGRVAKRTFLGSLSVGEFYFKLSKTSSSTLEGVVFEP